MEILKQNAHVFVDYACMFFNECISLGNSPFVRKQTNITMIQMISNGLSLFSQ